MWKKIEAAWFALPPRLRVWLRGAEVAVVTAVVASCVAVPVADFRTKKGVSEFAAGVFAAAYGALRLYATQSPIPVAAKATNPAFTFNPLRPVVYTADIANAVTGSLQVGDVIGTGRGCEGETKIIAPGQESGKAPKQGESK